MKFKNLKGILFDFDGVLVKSMEYHFFAWKKAMKQYGINIKEDDYYPLEGMRLKLIAKLLCEKYNSDKTDYDGIVKLKIKNYISTHKTQVYPGVKNLLKLLNRRKIKKAIVSASTFELLESSVGKEFLKNFDVIIDGNSSKRGKPHPDPYLTALKKLGFNKNEVIIIENAPLGIKSAKSSKIFCVGITSTVDKEKLKNADLIINKISEIKEFIL